MTEPLKPRSVPARDASKRVMYAFYDALAATPAEGPRTDAQYAIKQLMAETGMTYPVAAIDVAIRKAASLIDLAKAAVANPLADETEARWPPTSAAAHHPPKEVEP